ncbi:MAG: hypothetical protein CMM26_14565 [Rhodospirillaceae bacterium]|nr:hypothetical protein [Rhodospirillaceae bacterium]
MTNSIKIAHAGRHVLNVTLGRALRLGDGDYPLFKPPAAEAVAAPDDCLAFLRELHVSLLDVFDIACRRWVNGYFDAVVAHVDGARGSLVAPIGAETVANAHRV